MGASRRPTRRLVAPHRRHGGPPRVIERAGLLAYRLAEWSLGRVPPEPATALLNAVFQASYLAWPTKRRWINENYAHVLGRRPDDPEVRRLARAAYRSYARYVVELIRLPSLSDEAAAQLVDVSDLLPLEEIWRQSPGLILTTGHVGNLEAVARAVAGHGWPVNAVADDSAFPELFEHLRRQRERWSVRLIPWRNLRAIYEVLRRREVLVLIVDWGYRPDGIPVRLFGTWTTLPAGPATLAARTGALVVPVAVRRDDHGRFRFGYSEPIRVASTRPADLAVATQAIAEGLERSIAAAPDQWYSFKPLWPADEAEKAALADRAAAMLATG